jgi:AcrR family transcriptional regulator
MTKDARMVRTDQSLRAALLKLLEREPLDAITIRQICVEAEVHYATFFRHHVSKEALLDHVAKDQVARLIELSLPVSDAAGDEAGFLALCSYVDEHRKLWSALLTGGAGGTMREELLRRSMKTAAERAPVHAWLPVDLATICTVSLIIETLAWWVKQPARAHPVKEVAKMLHRLLHSSELLTDSRR